MLNYEIYQLKADADLHNIRFANIKFMNSHGIPIEADNYDKVYSGVIDDENGGRKKSTGEVLEILYEKFNLRHPADFRGHSLSVSDVVTLHDNGVVTAHYCDSYGFTQVPEFIQPDAFVNLDSFGIAVSGHFGTWHTIESHNIQGREFYLMESDDFGADAANVIVDGTGKLVAEDVLTGFTPEIVQMITEEQQLAPYRTNLLQEDESNRRQTSKHIAENASGDPGVNALLGCHNLALSCCHEIARISVMECSFCDGADSRPITKGISSCIHALPAL